MFDSPDLGPVFCAPFVATVFTVLFYAVFTLVGMAIEKKRGEKLKNWNSIFLLVALFLTPVACLLSVEFGIGELDPVPWFKPSTKSVAGVWVLTSDTVLDSQRPAKVIEPVQEITIYEDGTFEVAQMPDLWIFTDSTSPPQKVTYFYGSGEWHLEKLQTSSRNQWGLILEFAEIDGEEVDQVAHFLFQEHTSPYTLWGTNDGYAVFEFERQ